MADSDGVVEPGIGEVRALTRLTRSELVRFHQGDEAVFRRLVEAFTPRLLAVVRPFATNRDEAHDLLQDTWKRAFEKRRSFSGRGTVLGWLYAVCRNVCLGAQRKRTARGGPVHAADHPMGTPPAEPHEAVEQLELRRSIYRAVMELPDREREVVVLRMLEERSTRETAAILGCAEGTVKAALHHALKKLQGSMEVWIR